VGIALALAFVVGIMVYAIRMDDLMNTPPEGTEQSVPAPPAQPVPLNH